MRWAARQSSIAFCDIASFPSLLALLLVLLVLWPESRNYLLPNPPSVRKLDDNWKKLKNDTVRENCF